MLSRFLKAVIFLMCSSSLCLAEFPVPPTRQVHLDFHTSEHIEGIGARFDKAQFQDALRVGHVNAINIFAKGHHSWSYYPTKVGQQHPQLDFDLLGAQIEACHEMGVRCPIYYTVGWSAHDAEVHAEWCSRDRKGAIITNGTVDPNAKPTDPRPWGWRKMCAVSGGPYQAHMLAQVEEICQLYPVDGFFFDIYNDTACYCPTCRTRLAQEGVDLDDETAVVRSHALAIKQHMRELRALIKRHHPAATVFFNSATHVGNTALFKERLFDLNTQQELEDLPTTWGGYDKLPIEAKFHLGEGSRVLAMSGKFHKAWGEFGGFKAADAIKYEAASMIANGAACNFGDQLHPSGEMDIETYRNIGKAFAYVEQIEAYGPGWVPVSNLGVWLTLDDAADRGVVNMLLEMHVDFVPVSQRNLTGLRTIVIPSQPCLSDGDVAALTEWVERGGRLILFGAGAMDAGRSRFLFDIGADYVGPANFDCDYTVMKRAMSDDIVSTPFLNYTPGMRTLLTTGEALAMIREPYFSRTYAHFSSHAKTPYRLEDSAHPAVIRHGNIVFFAHPLDRLYYAHGVRLHRELFKAVINELDVQPMLAVRGLPSSGRANLLKQAASERYVAHLLYSPALQRGDVRVIEDFPPIPGVIIGVRVPEKIKTVRAIPSGETLAFVQRDGVVEVDVPTFTMHTAIVLDY